MSLQPHSTKSDSLRISKSNHPDRAIVVVGSLAFDSIKTPFGSEEKILGGAANHFALSAGFFTGIRLVGVVGEDMPEDYFSTMKNHGIDIEGLSVEPGKTFHWSGEYGKNLNEAKTLSTCLNVFEHFNPKLPESYRDSKYVFLANIDPDLQTLVHSQVKKPKLVAMDSMNFWITSKRDSLLRALEISNLLTINEGEAFLLSGKSNIVEAADAIRALGPKVLVIKRGEYGALLFTDHGIFSAPALPLKSVKDPTGAGDTFAGGLMGYLAHEGVEHASWNQHEATLRKAVIFGCVMASFCVEDFGFRNTLRVTVPQAQDRFDTFMRMTRF